MTFQYHDSFRYSDTQISDIQLSDTQIFRHTLPAWLGQKMIQIGICAWTVLDVNDQLSTDNYGFPSQLIMTNRVLCTVHQLLMDSSQCKSHYLLVLYRNPSTNGANKSNTPDISGLWPCSLVRLREAKECEKVRESDHYPGLIKRQGRS